MVLQKRRTDRRAFVRRRNNLCRTCVTVLSVAAVLLPPVVWERVVSIANMLSGSPVKVTRDAQAAARHGS